MTMAEPTGAERRALEAKRGLSPVRRSYAVDGVELRAGEPDSNFAHLTGHASATGRSYEMYGGPEKGGWNEYVDQGSFKRTLSQKPDVAFLLNHTGLTLARTKAGTLALAEDSGGLSVDAPKLDKRVSVINDMTILMEQGNLDEMSFAFRVMKQTWLDDDGDEVPWWDESGTDRHITEVNIHKGDVSVVNYGANPHADAALRSLSDTMRELTDIDSLDPEELRAAADYLLSRIPTPEVDTNLIVLQLQRERRARLARL